MSEVGREKHREKLRAIFIKNVFHFQLPILHILFWDFTYMLVLCNGDRQWRG